MKAAIFDMDGTIIDSMWVWDEIDREYPMRYNHTLSAKEHLAIASMSLIEACVYFKELLQLEKTPEEIRNDLLDMARDYYQTRITLKPYALDYIKSLRAKGIKTAVATASPREFAEIVLGRFDLHQYFEVVLTSCEFPKGKTDSEMYEKCSALLGVSIDDTVIFEDAHHAVQTAKGAGYTVVGIADQNNRHTPEQIIPLCDRFIESWKELL